jgi:hypothetical protein
MEAKARLSGPWLLNDLLETQRRKRMKLDFNVSVRTFHLDGDVAELISAHLFLSGHLLKR